MLTSPSGFALTTTNMMKRVGGRYQFGRGETHPTPSTPPKKGMTPLTMQAMSQVKAGPNIMYASTADVSGD